MKPKAGATQHTKKKHAENLRDRFVFFMGNNTDAIIRKSLDRDKWGAEAVVPDPELFDSLAEEIELEQTEPKFEFDSSQQRLTKVSDPISIHPDDTISIQVSLQSEEKTLRPFEFTPLIDPTNKGLVLFAGSCITDAQWAPGFQGNVQYIAVSTLDDKGRLGSESISQETAIFASYHYKSTIQIYEYLVEVNTIRLYSTLTADYGSPLWMRWRPISDIGKSIGTLAACFQDGSVRFLDVPFTETYTNYRIDAPLQAYSIPEDKISCVEWRTNEIIVVGTTYGALAEFDISDTSSTLPSYYMPVHSALITAISTGFPDNSHVVFTASVDGYYRILDVNDLKRARAISTRFKGVPMFADYAPKVQSFLCIDEVHHCRMAPIRMANMSLGGSNLASHDGAVTAASASYCHPLVASGGAEGSLHLSNAYRRAFLHRRVTTEYHKHATVWTFEVEESLKKEEALQSSKTFKFRFVDTLKMSSFLRPSTGKKQQRDVIYPPTVAVTTTAWNPNMGQGALLVSGLSAGILRIDDFAKK
ncbi:hypothetical protein TRVA0_030S00870 [Trichomonascus vanleenenianus]|uniref:transcription factor TFIIIC subunit TFC6 n=1 Tax=Trichomonascus vanleenenianus TaxID=2268995 RepID=UPI003ECA8DD1